jgi:hypothetical protein
MLFIHDKEWASPGTYSLIVSMMYSHPSLVVSQLKGFFAGFSFVYFVVMFSSGFWFHPTHSCYCQIRLFWSNNVIIGSKKSLMSSQIASVFWYLIYGQSLSSTKYGFSFSKSWVNCAVIAEWLNFIVSIRILLYVSPALAVWCGFFSFFANHLRINYVASQIKRHV